MANDNNKAENEFQCFRIKPISPVGETPKPVEIEMIHPEPEPCCSAMGDNSDSVCDQKKEKSKIWQFLFGKKRQNVTQKRDICYCCCCTNNRCEKKDKLVQNKCERQLKNEGKQQFINVSGYGPSKHKKKIGECPGKLLPLQRRGCGCHLYFCIDSKSKGSQMKMKRMKNMKNENIKSQEYSTFEDNNMSSSKGICDCDDRKQTSVDIDVKDQSLLSKTSPKITIYCDDPNKDSDMMKPSEYPQTPSSPTTPNKKINFKEAFGKHRPLSIEGDPIFSPRNQSPRPPTPLMTTRPLLRPSSPPAMPKGTFPVYQVDHLNQYEPFIPRDNTEEEQTERRNSIKPNFRTNNKDREFRNSINEEPQVFDNRLFATLEDHEEASRPRKGSILRNRNSEVVLNIALLNKPEEPFKATNGKDGNEESVTESLISKESQKKTVVKEDSSIIIRPPKPLTKTESGSKATDESDPEEEAIFKEYDTFRKTQRDKKSSIKSQTFVRNSLINIRKEFNKSSLSGQKNSLLPKNYIKQMSLGLQGGQKRSRTNEILEKLDSIEEKIKELERVYENKDKNMTIGFSCDSSKSVVSIRLKDQQLNNNSAEEGHRKQKEKVFPTASASNILFKNSFVEIKTEEEDVYLSAPKSVSVIKKIRSGSSTYSKRPENSSFQVQNVKKKSSKSDCKTIECLNPKIVLEYPKKAKSGKKQELICCDTWRRISEELKVSNPDMTKFNKCPCTKCSKKGL